MQDNKITSTEQTKWRNFHDRHLIQFWMLYRHNVIYKAQILYLAEAHSDTFAWHVANAKMLHFCLVQQIFDAMQRKMTYNYYIKYYSSLQRHTLKGKGICISIFKYGLMKIKYVTLFCQIISLECASDTYNVWVQSMSQALHNPPVNKELQGESVTNDVHILFFINRKEK